MPGQFIYLTSNLFYFFFLSIKQFKDHFQRILFIAGQLERGKRKLLHRQITKLYTQIYYKQCSENFQSAWQFHYVEEVSRRIATLWQTLSTREEFVGEVEMTIMLQASWEILVS